MAKDFLNAVNEFAQALNVEIKDDIIHILKNGCSTSNSSPVLDFTGAYLDEPTCRVLSRVLENDVYYREILLVDLKLSDKLSILPILSVLEMNVCLRHLSLKGFDMLNVSEQILPLLTNIILRTKSLEKLDLEWTKLGLIGRDNDCGKIELNLLLDSFSNSYGSLRIINLRNNYINEQFLQTLLRKLFVPQSLIEEIDLSYNHLGNGGGECLLNWLKNSSRSIKVQIDGCNISTELWEKITSFSSKKNQSQKLTRHYAMDYSNEKEETWKQVNKAMSSKVSSLQVALRERKTTCEKAIQQLSIRDAKLLISGKTINDLQLKVKEIEKEKMLFQEKLTAEFNVERERLSSELRISRSEIEKLKTNIITSREEMKEHEMKVRELSDLQLEQKERISSLLMKHQSKLNELENEARKEREERRRTNELAQEESKRELDQIRMRHRLEMEEFEEKFQQLKSQKTHLIQEISDVRSSITKQRLMIEQQFIEEKNELVKKLDNEKSSLMNKIYESQNKYQTCEEECSRVKQKMEEFQIKYTSTHREEESLKRTNELLKQELLAADTKCVEATTKIKIEMTDQLNEMKDEVNENRSLKEKLKRCKKELEEVQSKYEMNNRRSVEEIEELKKKLKTSEDATHQLEILEKQRAKNMFEAIKMNFDMK
ncbi:hypothetical protein SNEBB_003463 [Seison nebaliae]|nr:hypothetical protein SNEBB_003463 [Seison nebaliae]